MNSLEDTVDVEHICPCWNQLGVPKDPRTGLVLPKHDAHVDVRSEDGDRPQARRIVEQFCACPLTPRINLSSQHFYMYAWWAAHGHCGGGGVAGC